MFYKYAAYSKRHNAVHYSILFCIFVIFVAHIIWLLSDEKLWLLLGIFIYIPITICWCKISTFRDRMSD